MVLDGMYKATVIISSILLIVAFVATLLRIYARKLTPSGFFIDDHLIFAALILLLGNSAPCIIANSIISRDEGDNNPSGHVLFRKPFFFLQLIYIISIAVVKISITLFYKRIFPTKNFERASNALLALVCAWFIAFFFVTLFHFNPKSANWEDVPRPQTLDFNAASIALGASDTFLDVATLILPWPIIYSLHVTIRKKWSICGIFLLSSLTCIASGIRLYYLIRLVKDGDPSATKHPRDTLNIFLWSAIENAGSVICACLPTFGPIFKKHPLSTLATLFKAHLKFRKLNILCFTDDKQSLHSDQRSEVSRYAKRPNCVPTLSFDSKRFITRVRTSPTLEANRWNGENSGRLEGIMVYTHINSMSEESEPTSQTATEAGVQEV